MAEVMFDVLKKKHVMLVPVMLILCAIIRCC